MQRTPFRTAVTIGLAICVITSMVAAGTAPAQGQAPNWANHSGVFIDINLPAYRLTTYDDGHQAARYPIGIGRVNGQTPPGDYWLVKRVTDPTFYPIDGEPMPPGPNNPLGVCWLGLNISGYGIHGTNRPETIGTAVTGGCIRLVNQEALAVFELVMSQPIWKTRVRIRYDLADVVWAGDQYWLEVYPDIYQKGFDGVLPRVQFLMREVGLNPDYLWHNVVSLLEGDHAPERVLRFPLGVPVEVNDNILNPPALAFASGELLVPLPEVLDALIIDFRAIGRSTVAISLPPGPASMFEEQSQVSIEGYNFHDTIYVSTTKLQEVVDGALVCDLVDNKVLVSWPRAYAHYRNSKSEFITSRLIIVNGEPLIELESALGYLRGRDLIDTDPVVVHLSDDRSLVGLGQFTVGGQRLGDDVFVEAVPLFRAFGYTVVWAKGTRTLHLF